MESSVPERGDILQMRKFLQMRLRIHVAELGNHVVGRGQGMTLLERILNSTLHL